MAQYWNAPLGASYYQWPNNYANSYTPVNNTGNLQQMQIPQTQTNSINWVQGKAGAEAYPVAPGASVMLMDSSEPILYVKSADNTGRPLPLKVYDLVERNDQTEAAKATSTITAQEIDYDKIRQIVSEEVSKRVANGHAKPAQGKKEGK